MQADIRRPLPFASRSFHAVLCALVGEHLPTLGQPLREMQRVLRPAGRLVFSVYHPAMAAAGIEANFSEEGVEYRLGAYRHTVDGYLDALRAVGLVEIEQRELCGDEELIGVIPAARRYLGFPVLLLVRARRPGG